MKTITPEELRDRLESDGDFHLIDTRRSGDYNSWRINESINYRYNPGGKVDIEDFKNKTGIDQDEKILTLCAKGISSFDFAEQLEDGGYDNVTVVEDGMEGWSAVYDTTEVPTDSHNLQIIQVQRRAKGCLGYVVASKEESAVIDATRHTEEFVSVAEELGVEIKHVFDTHVHADHISGGRKLADEVGATYYMGSKAEERVNYDFEPLEHNQVVEVGDIDIKAVHTPGHTSDMTSYLVDSEAVMTGDTLFVESVGRTELQFGDEKASAGAEMLYDSLHRTLLSLPDSIKVLPGHFSVTNKGEYPDATPGEPAYSTIGELRTGSDALQRERDEFIRKVSENVPEKPPNYEDVIGVNEGKKQLHDEQQAVELELGPNRCAAE